MTPASEIRSYEGLNPVTPQNDAGRTIEPIVCVPSVSGHRPAATAAADPLLEPPGVCSGLCGFRVGPGPKYANSVVTVLPRINAPAFFNRFTLSASGPCKS